MPKGVRRALTAMASLVLIGLIMVVHSLILSPAQETEPISFSGAIGSTVDADTFTVTVDKVQFAQEVTDKGGLGGSGPIKANGVWVVVWVDLTATKKTLNNVTAELNAGKYTYSASPWLMNSLTGSSAPFDPGITRYGAFAFEAPKKRLSDLTLRVRLGESYDDRLAPRADVDLQLSGADLADKIDKARDSISIPPIETR